MKNLLKFAVKDKPSIAVLLIGAVLLPAFVLVVGFMNSSNVRLQLSLFDNHVAILDLDAEVTLPEAFTESIRDVEVSDFRHHSWLYHLGKLIFRIDDNLSVAEMQNRYGAIIDATIDVLLAQSDFTEPDIGFLSHSIYAQWWYAEFLGENFNADRVALFENILNHHGAYAVFCHNNIQTPTHIPVAIEIVAITLTLILISLSMLIVSRRKKSKVCT